MTTSSYALGTALPVPYDEAVERVRSALADEGFGVLTEIDVAETLRRKLDVDFRRYVILGACNPALAHRALSADGEAGLLLPCNVVVQESDDGGESLISVLDPIAALGIAGKDELREVALEARARLERVVAALGR
jgi:uncharacterized protein (DUF302 family)